jgi:hypothetical protein
MEQPIPGSCRGHFDSKDKNCRACIIALRCAEETQRDKKDTGKFFIGRILPKYNREDAEYGGLRVHKFYKSRTLVCVIKISKETKRLLVSHIGQGAPEVFEPFLHPGEAISAADAINMAVFANIEKEPENDPGC